MYPSLRNIRLAAVYMLNLIELGLGKPLSGMVTKRLLITNIFAEHPERLMPTMLLHLEQVGALSPRLGQEACA